MFAQRGSTGVMLEWPGHLCQLTATGYKMVTYDTKIGVKGCSSANKRDVLLLMKPCWFYDGSGWCCRWVDIGFYGAGASVFGEGTNIGKV